MIIWKKTLRDFLAHGGRVLVEPTGALTEGGAVPRWFVEGDVPETDIAIAAHRAYFARRDQAFRQRVKRAARMLGRRTQNGWRVLEVADGNSSPV
ncbi:hypothetical protein [Novosphingobium jiangmenense]|uniref:Uncharacterized protein n=1 Tax=Novosphingobium jiangmenense TaxID=2791981 RepID=A0ABS0HF42_9SPHN|nr:hypothetical protein [Novosphingobium jiangmenense]MBF9150885.1 hypothetical protein [Novosphingobium jiangmenense]